jgi:hypothetical protein
MGRRAKGLNISPGWLYVSGMAKSPVPSPREKLTIRRLPPVGTKIPLNVEVVRHGRNGHDTADTITIRIPGFGTPVTVNADYLVGDED